MMRLASGFSHFLEMEAFGDCFWFEYTSVKTTNNWRSPIAARCLHCPSQCLMFRFDILYQLFPQS